MRVDVATLISELLYEHNSVIVPGLGGFVAQQKTATIDQVQGTLSPPSKELDFNDHLVVNDGLLINAVANRYHLTHETARRTVEEFVEEVKEALKGREMYRVPKVGRLYQDYEGNLKILPDNTNFNTESYGLPSVQFYPVLKRQEQAAADIPGATSATKKSKLASSNISSLFQRALPFIAGLAVVIVALSIYLLLQDNEPAPTITENNPQLEEPVQLMPTGEGKKRINIPPGSDKNKEATAPSYQNNAPINSEGENESPIDTDKPTLSPTQKEAIIVIGKFGNRENVQKLVQKIYQAGYDAYTDNDEGLTRVGVQLAYEDQAELNRVLQNVRRKFEKNAWVLKK